MEEWGKDQEAENVLLLPDGNGAFTEAMGMLVDKSDLNFGKRSWRYSMLVRDKVDREDVHRAGEAGRPVQGVGRRHHAALPRSEGEAPDQIAILTREGCAFCAKAKKMLSEAGVDYAEVPLPHTVRTQGARRDRQGADRAAGVRQRRAGRRLAEAGCMAEGPAPPPEGLNRNYPCSWVAALSAPRNHDCRLRLAARGMHEAFWSSDVRMGGSRFGRRVRGRLRRKQRRVVARSGGRAAASVRRAVPSPRPDGRIALAIPAGALGAATEIRIVELSGDAIPAAFRPAAADKVYRLEPRAGTTFAVPVRVTLVLPPSPTGSDRDDAARVRAVSSRCR